MQSNTSAPASYYPYTSGWPTYSSYASYTTPSYYNYNNNSSSSWYNAYNANHISNALSLSYKNYNRPTSYTSYSPLFSSSGHLASVLLAADFYPPVGKQSLGHESLVCRIISNPTSCSRACRERSPCSPTKCTTLLPWHEHIRDHGTECYRCCADGMAGHSKAACSIQAF